MYDWLSSRAYNSAERLALVSSDQTSPTMTYSALDAAAARLASQLAQFGVRRGDRVAYAMPNGAATVTLIHALIRSGAVLVPINTRLTAVEAARQVEGAGCAGLIVDARTRDIASRTASCPVWPIEDILAREATDAAPPRQIDLNETFAIIHTSGTSGEPKGAMLSYGNVFYSAAATAWHTGALPGDRWLCTLPLYHVGGLSIVTRSVLSGATIDLHAGWNADAVCAALTREPITQVSLVPTQLHRLLPRLNEWTPTLRLILLGGDATSPELHRQCVERGLPIAPTYGLTEAASQVATALPDRAKVGSVGRPLLFVRVRIAGEVDVRAGGDVPPGAQGEIVVSGPTVMQGYLDPAATAQVMRSGELFTGDVGYSDEAGDLFVLRRRTDLILSGGENVYPAEVEAVLKQHAWVNDACVVGLPHAEWGQQVAAAIVLKRGALGDVGPHEVGPREVALQLEQHCRAHLAGYKVPRRFKFVDELPRAGAGKIDRRAVAVAFDAASFA